jgi:hypothetical protein
MLMDLNPNIDAATAFSRPAAGTAFGTVAVAPGLVIPVGTLRGVNRALGYGRNRLSLHLKGRLGRFLRQNIGHYGCLDGRNRHTIPPRNYTAGGKFLHALNEENLNQFGVNYILGKNLQTIPVKGVVEIWVQS